MNQPTVYFADINDPDETDTDKPNFCDVVLAKDYDALAADLWRAHVSFADAMEVERGKFVATINALHSALEQIQHELQKGRVWNGMGWTYTGLHMIYQNRALSILEDALASQPQANRETEHE